MRARFLLSLLAVLAVLSSACGIGSDGPVGATRAELRDLDAIEQEFLDLLNAYRRDNGLGVVMSERALAQGALDYSQLMGVTATFDHVGPDGSTFDERMCAAGYDPGCGPRTFVAENLAAGQWSAAEVFEAWRTSPGHDSNMRDERARVVGVGRAEVPGSPYDVYWTNTFGGSVTDQAVPVDPAPPSDAGAVAADGGVTGDGGATGDGGIALGGRGRRSRGCAAAGGASAPAGTAWLLLPPVALLAARRGRRRQRSW